MPDLEAALTRRRFAETLRKDLWWLQSLLTFIGLGSFVFYATWAAMQGNHFEWGPYLSPFYSPLLFGDSAHSWFGARPGWMPSMGYSSDADSVGTGGISRYLLLLSRRILQIILGRSTSLCRR